MGITQKLTEELHRTGAIHQDLDLTYNDIGTRQYRYLYVDEKNLEFGKRVWSNWTGERLHIFVSRHRSEGKNITVFEKKERVI